MEEKKPEVKFATLRTVSKRFVYLVVAISILALLAFAFQYVFGAYLGCMIVGALQTYLQIDKVTQTRVYDWVTDVAEYAGNAVGDFAAWVSDCFKRPATPAAA